MAINIIFEANEFLKGVAGVKSFWLSSKLNKLRIEGHKDTKKVDFIAINRETGLETVVTVPAFVSEDTVLHIKTVNSFYSAVEILQEVNVGKNNPLRLRLVPSREDKKHFTLEVMLSHWDIVATVEKGNKS